MTRLSWRAWWRAATTSSSSAPIQRHSLSAGVSGDENKMAKQSGVQKGVQNDVCCIEGDVEWKETQSSF